MTRCNFRHLARSYISDARNGIRGLATSLDEPKR